MARPLSPTLRELSAFRSLLQTRSATGTALSLNVTQPAISKALRQLEGELGIKLFERVGGRLYPTPEAEQLLPAVDGVLSSMSALSDAGQAIRGQRIGQVTISAIPTLSTVFLPAAVEIVARKHPDMRVATSVLPTQQVVDSVARGLMELGLVHSIVAAPPLVDFEDIGEAEVSCVVRKDHPLARRRYIEPHMLRGMPMVSFIQNSPIGVCLHAAFEAAGERFQPTMEATSSTVVCSLAHECNIPGLVEGYVLSLGWWPELRAIPMAPSIPIQPRILTTRQRPLSIAGKLLRDEVRRLVVERLPSKKRRR
jgi:DNA-binding transcriptional LysR family regulator